MSEIDDSKAPLLDHLVELRRRLVWSVLALFICFGVSFYFVDYIFAILVQPLADAFPAGEGKLVYTKLYEAFFVEVKLSLFAGFFFAFPVIATQIWRFVAPACIKMRSEPLRPFWLRRRFCLSRVHHWHIMWSCPRPLSFSLDFREKPAACR